MKQITFLGKPQKKVLLLMAGPLRPNPPPLELNGRWNVGTFLNGPALYPLVLRL